MTAALKAASGRWAIYLRISRTDDRLGVERQLDICRLQLAAMGVDDVEVYDENNSTATKGLEYRPEYVRLVADVAAGRVVGIMVFVQDRAWRDTDELSAFIKLKARLATSATGELDLDDPDTLANVKTNTVNAERETKLTSKRVKAASKQRAALGLAHGRAGFGWRREVELKSGRVVSRWDELDEAEAGMLRYAAGRLLDGISLRTVVAEVEAGDVRPRPMTFKKRGTESRRRWTSQQLKTLLLRESNAGHRIYKGEVLPGVVGDWPPIFDEVTFRRLKLLFADPTRRSNDRGSTRRWLLSDIATCGVCADGGRIGVHTGGNRENARAVYVCVGKPGSQGCFQRHFVDDVNAQVARLVAERIVDPAFSQADPTAQLKIDDLDAEIDRQRARIDAADNAAAEETISLGALAKITKAARERIADLEQERSDLIPSTIKLGFGGGEFALMPVAEQRAAVRALFASVVFVPNPVHGKSRKPEQALDGIRYDYRGRAA